MAHPDFFDRIPTVTLRDPLSHLLGTAEDGLMEYSYAEVVKLTGHSCPTVAGAWIMTTGALRRLYGSEPPLRGGISAAFRQSAVEGVTGVIASVVGYLTGATVDTGFKGLRGQFDRRNLLHFEQPIDGDLCFERLDTGARVTATFNAAVVPAAPGLMPQLFAALGPASTPAQRAAFAEAWQDRVRRIFENADHPELVHYG